MDAAFAERLELWKERDAHPAEQGQGALPWPLPERSAGTEDISNADRLPRPGSPKQLDSADIGQKRSTSCELG